MRINYIVIYYTFLDKGNKKTMQYVILNRKKV
jgi:hypothetical protein